MRTYVEKAVQELKEAGEWDSNEERINYQFDSYPPNSPKRALILIILRGEEPETILINLDFKRTKRCDRIAEIKRQIKTYFESEAHKKTKWPKVFTIKEVLRDYPTISKWFYGTGA